MLLGNTQRYPSEIRSGIPQKYAAVSLRCYVGCFCRSPLQVSFGVFRSVLNVCVEEATYSSEIRSGIPQVLCRSLLQVFFIHSSLLM